MTDAYDIIGDIHGHATELRALLERLGYERNGTFYRHPLRRAIFLGDFIDRGPQIREVLEMVHGMVETGSALAILGNHEVNAIRFNTKGSDGDYLRPHSPKNIRQHQETLAQFPDHATWTPWLTWFAGLPLSLDLGGLRVVHASWDDSAVAELSGVGRLEGTTLEKYTEKTGQAHHVMSRLINGPESTLPVGFQFKMPDGSRRSEIRVKWWLDLEGFTCRESIFPDHDEMPDLPLQDVPKTGYPEDAPPTFFGHYALKDAVPKPIRPNLACLDYGVGKGGFLCAYRWDGEEAIDPEKFIAVGS